MSLAGHAVLTPHGMSDSKARESAETKKHSATVPVPRGPVSSLDLAPSRVDSQPLILEVINKSRDGWSNKRMTVPVNILGTTVRLIGESAGRHCLLRTRPGIS